MAEEGIHYVQLGTFSELHHLPNHFRVTLRQLAEEYQMSGLAVIQRPGHGGGYLDQ